MSMDQLLTITRSLNRLNKAEQQVRFRLAKASGLNTSEFEVLTTLLYYDRPMNVKELAQELMLCSQAVTKITKRLNSLHLISLNKSEQDRRATMVDLLEKGRVLALWDAQVLQRLYEEALRGEDTTEIGEFAAAIRVLESRVTEETEHLESSQTSFKGPSTPQA